MYHIYKVTWYVQTSDWPNSQTLEEEKFFVDKSLADAFLTTVKELPDYVGGTVSKVYVIESPNPDEMR